MKKIISVFLSCVMLLTLFVPFTFAGNDAASEACASWGDIDGDGTTTSGDARFVLRQSVNLESFPEEALYRSDLDKDGKISSGDARFVLRLSVKLEEYPAHELLPIIGKDVTCTVDGMTDGLYCTICQKEFKPQEVIPATGHKEVVDDAVAATCTTDGLTEGKHCETCGEILVAQEVIPALGHHPVAATATDAEICKPAEFCDRCGEELSPELKHEYAANATVTAEKGIVCTRCGNTTVPSFNNLVNALKQEEHIFRTFSKTDTEIFSPKFTGVMLLFKSAFEEEFKNNMGVETEYTTLSEKTEVNPDTFEIIGSDAVSLLTDADLQSTKTQTVNGIEFLKDLPDTITGPYGRTNDLTQIKAKEFGDVLKVTVVVKPERYSELADKGGTDGIGRISSEYGNLIKSAMSEFSSLNEDFLKSECDSVSTATVTYYFDKATLKPITAVYNVNMDMDQAMNLYITKTGEKTNVSTGSISFKISTDINSYFFFDGYFD